MMQDNEKIVSLFFKNDFVDKSPELLSPEKFDEYLEYAYHQLATLKKFQDAIKSYTNLAKHALKEKDFLLLKKLAFGLNQSYQILKDSQESLGIRDLVSSISCQCFTAAIENQQSENKEPLYLIGSIYKLMAINFSCKDSFDRNNKKNDEKTKDVIELVNGKLSNGHSYEGDFFNMVLLSCIYSFSDISKNTAMKSYIDLRLYSSRVPALFDMILQMRRILPTNQKFDQYISKNLENFFNSKDNVPSLSDREYDFLKIATSYLAFITNPDLVIKFLFHCIDMRLIEYRIISPVITLIEEFNDAHLDKYDLPKNNSKKFYCLKLLDYLSQSELVLAAEVMEEGYDNDLDYEFLYCPIHRWITPEIFRNSQLSNQRKHVILEIVLKKYFFGNDKNYTREEVAEFLNVSYSDDFKFGGLDDSIIHPFFFAAIKIIENNDYSKYKNNFFNQELEENKIEIEKIKSELFNIISIEEKRIDDINIRLQNDPLNSLKNKIEEINYKISCKMTELQKSLKEYKYHIGILEENLKTEMNIFNELKSSLDNIQIRIETLKDKSKNAYQYELKSIEALIKDSEALIIDKNNALIARKKNIERLKLSISDIKKSEGNDKERLTFLENQKEPKNILNQITEEMKGRKKCIEDFKKLIAEKVDNTNENSSSFEK